MTQRERQTPEGGTQAATGPIRDPSAPPSTPPGPGSEALSLWEELYHAATPAQRQEFLDLASRQGLLYAHQLPVSTNGSSGSSLRPILPALLNGQTQFLEPVRPEPVVPFDIDLDLAQREAVARSLNTPDVCLIQGLPGTGKSRVLAEIVRQAAARGERVLLLAPTAAAIDQVLECLGTQAGVCPVRCLAPEEEPESLAPCIRRLTLDGHARYFREHTLTRARQEVEAARQRCERYQGWECSWERLEELAARHGELSDQLRELAERRSALASEVEALAAAVAEGSDSDTVSPLQTQLLARLRARDEARAHVEARLAEVRAEVEKRRVEQEKVAEELERLRPLTEAKQGGRWWTGAWWRATFQGGAVAHAADLQIRTEKLREEQARLDQEVNQLAREGTAADDAYAAERTRLVGAEVQRRQARLDDEAAALRQEQNLLQAKWQATCQEMGLAPEPAISREAAREARQAWEQGRVQNEQERAFADQWVRSLEETLDGLPRRLAACFNVVAATTTGLPAGDPFTGRGPNGHPFDRLILDEADRITDSEFLAAARNAPCWVLVGEPANPDHPSRSTDRKAKSSGFRSAIRDPRSAFFQRLWPQLHADPQQLPYAWGRREGHLFCRLRHVPRGHEQWIERECVVDRPDIELHIVAVPRQAPQLAEVVFPPGMPIEQAKQFVFQELEELPLQAPGHGLWWVEGPERIELRLTPDDDAAAVSVVLEPGVRELVRVPAPGAECDGPWYTCGIHFDRDAGWSRERAEDWVEKYLGIRDRGRTALLTKPHRWRPPLACILADLLGANWDRSAGPSAPECASLEFVAVPPASEPEVARRVEAEGRRRSGGTATAVPRQRGARGGAGLEIDLADNRPLEPLPEELRAFLPSDGLVNYFEARAVVQALESLVAEETFRAEAEAWPPRHKAPCLLASEGCVSGGQGLSSSYRPVHSPAVVVMALYSAQAELIRLLIRQSPTLAVCDISLEVGLPSDFRQRECLAALVSLTRSHVHRAVTFGEVPELLTLALTRAAARLLIFGDPGTLERRASWQGALDHLDPTEAEQERTLVLGLLRFAHPLPLTPSINHHPEGGSA